MIANQIEYRNAREQAAHKLTGVVCGQCKCSNYLGWSKPEMQPNCECYQLAGELEEIFTLNLCNRI